MQEQTPDTVLEQQPAAAEPEAAAQQPAADTQQPAEAAAPAKEEAPAQPAEPAAVTVVDIRFRNNAKSYYFDPAGLTLQAGAHVIIDTARGDEFGLCAAGNHPVKPRELVLPLRRVLRVATQQDERANAENQEKEKKAFEICQQKIAAHGLEMQLVSAECAFDGSKLLFFFTADGRVDFRELVKDLASVFRTRIELRQIGVRDKAKMVGGLGVCGRPFCCKEFLDDFQPVSIKMAKTQNLSLNPTKISGTCGRLMCCLKYEQNAYEDAVRRCPKAESFVATPDGLGNVSSVDILREQVLVRLDGQNEGPKRYRTCEIQVLRNGKGSRDGIEIPTTLPERYQEPEEEELQLTPSFFSSAKPIVPPEQWTPPAAKDDADAEEETEKRRSRRGGRGHRGGRGRGKGHAEGGEKAEAQEKNAESRSEKPQRSEKANGGRRERPDRSTEKNGERRAPRQNKPNNENPDAPKAPRPPKAEGAGEGGENKPRRRSHRGGRGRRRSGGQGGENTAPKSES